MRIRGSDQGDEVGGGGGGGATPLSTHERFDARPGNQTGLSSQIILSVRFEFSRKTDHCPAV